MKRLPPLFLYFGIVGACAGWLSAVLLGHPLILAILPGRETLSAICGGVVGTVAGLWQTRRFLRRPAEVSHKRAIALDLVVLAFGGGALTGASVATLDQGLRYAAEGALHGLLCGALFLPVCALVLGATARSLRARHGSIVACVDARAVLGMLAVSLAAATLVALPAWPEARWYSSTGPWPAVAMALGAATVLAATLLLDLRAYRTVHEIAPRLAQMTALDAPAVESAPLTSRRIDLGVGDGVHAALSESRAVYRQRGTASELVRGDPCEAASLVRGAVRRGLLSMLVTGLVVALHAGAGSSSATAYYSTLMWEQVTPVHLPPARAPSH